MVVAVNKHDSKWVSPSALWSEFSDTKDKAVREIFQRPAILRFDNDNFMYELLSLMKYYPERLIEWQAQPETWREPMATPKSLEKFTVTKPISQLEQSQIRQLKLQDKTETEDIYKTNIFVKQTADKPLKLYQPAQKRFYLVTASLVCRTIGLPDRFVDLAKQQEVEFVIRRLIPKSAEEKTTPAVCNVADCDEYAYIITGNGSRWQKVQQGTVITNKVVLDEEERYPMFNLGYDEKEDKKRRMLGGFIPVSKREAYLNVDVVKSDVSENGDSDNSSSNDEINSDAKRDAIAQMFALQVAGPWKSLISQVYEELEKQSNWTGDNEPPIVDKLDGSPDPGPSQESNVNLLREKIQTASWYILVDFVQFLKDYIPNVYDYIKNSTVPAGITPLETTLYEALVDISINRSDYNNSYISDSYHNYNELFATLISALKHVMDNPEIETELDLVDYPYDRINENTESEHSWPDFLFPFTDPVQDGPLPDLVVTDPSDTEPDISHEKIDALTELVRTAVPEGLSRVAPEIAVFKELKSDRRDGWFVIRCVFESPNCGPFQLPIVSESTVPFKMASFFDPDAPGRPITIPMPLDVSPAGLRKFNKNTSFMISDMLCGKLKKMRKMTLGDLVLSVLPWPFHKDLPDPGDTGPCKKGTTGFGMICSLSIPIVTLCAMILLIIMVTLFDIFFRWLPLLFLCLPIPGLKGKKDA